MNQSLQGLIGDAAKSGWEWFDQADEKLRRNLDVRQGLESEDGKAIARAWADFAATPGGEKALLALHRTTLGRTVFFVHLGLAIDQFAAFGSFREGQNSLAHAIFRLIAKGQNEEGPPPRDV